MAASAGLDRALAIATAWDDRDRGLFTQGGPDTVGIVTVFGDRALL